MTPFVHDFAAIKASLERLEQEKRPVVVTDGEPVQWVDTVYGQYGSGLDTGPSEIP